jgi:hypothetical protein
MSSSPTIGIMSCSQLAYLAKVAANLLKEISSGKMDATVFPRGILADMKVFLNSAAEEAKYRIFGKMPSNPPAAITHYLHAVEAMTLQNALTSSGETLVLISLFINDLDGDPHAFSMEEMRYAGYVADFFEALLAIVSRR